MPADRKDDERIGRMLSQHADRRELDLDAFVTRIETQIRAELTGSAAASGPTDADVPVLAVVAAGKDETPVPFAAGLRARNRPSPRRLTPALVAAACVLAIVGAGVALLPRLTGHDDRGVGASSPMPGPSTGEGLPQSSRSMPAATSASVSGKRPPPPSPSGTASRPGAPSPGSRTGAEGGAQLPATFRWSSGAPVILPRTGGGAVTALKDPTVVRYGGKWHVFATTVTGGSYGIAYFSFSDWSQANSAKLYPLDAAPMGPGFRAAPQVFYFAPQKLWYLVYQTGVASYSTNSDINDPRGWSAPKPFYAGVPQLIKQNLNGGFWIDMWVICDEKDCYLFSSDNRGHLFRSQTAKAHFPHGMSQPVIAAEDVGKGTTFASSDVYKIAGTGKFLLLSQAFGGDGHGYLRSWTASRANGPWVPLADTSATPFVGAANTTYSGRAWTQDIVQGELLRDGYDETLTVSPCHLKFLYLGLNPDFKNDHTFQLGLMTQTNSTCS